MNDVCMRFKTFFVFRADLGTHTCGGYPGTLNYIQQDANTFASWGVDMLKLDGCYASAEIYETGYPNMTKALNATGRPIVFSCSWPAYIKTVSV
jgi:alpha-N-acetylgalactosaminidase